MNIFDIIGPVMIGPSSSHTAGAVRIGRVSWKILNDTAVEADIGLAGSFAMTYKGHGTDKALIAGVLGMKPDDERIPRSLEIAAQTGLKYRFSEIKISQAHPNTAVLRLKGAGGAECTVQGVSVGGGNIQITKLNGMDSVFNGDMDTLIVAHKDEPGMIAAVATRLAQAGANIGNFRLSRPHKGQEAIMTIELDGGAGQQKTLPDELSELKKLPGIVSVVYMRAAN